MYCFLYLGQIHHTVIWTYKSEQILCCCFLAVCADSDSDSVALSRALGLPLSAQFTFSFSRLLSLAHTRTLSRSWETDRNTSAEREYSWEWKSQKKALRYEQCENDKQVLRAVYIHYREFTLPSKVRDCRSENDHLMCVYMRQACGPFQLAFPVVLVVKTRRTRAWERQGTHRRSFVPNWVCEHDCIGHVRTYHGTHTHTHTHIHTLSFTHINTSIMHHLCRRDCADTKRKRASERSYLCRLVVKTRRARERDR